MTPIHHFLARRPPNQPSDSPVATSPCSSQSSSHQQSLHSQPSTVTSATSAAAAAAAAAAVTGQTTPTTASTSTSASASESVPTTKTAAVSDCLSKQQQQPPRKRRLTTSTFARRKRVATACQFCRLRKTKCDNKRPICSFCKYHGAKCIYGDESVAAPATADEENSSSTVGNASAEGDEKKYDVILERLDEIKRLLGDGAANAVRSVISGVTASVSESALGSEMPREHSSQSGWDAPQHQYSHSYSNSHPHTYPNPHQLQQYTQLPPPILPPLLSGHGPCPSLPARPESFLSWPIFASYLPPNFQLPNSLVFSTEQPAELDVGTGGIREEDVVALCRKFLLYVHSRNPILDSEVLMGYAREVRENGFAWDGKSCLVLIACALAAYTQPRSPHPVPPDTSGVSLQQSLSYYHAALKRLGLLPPTLLSIQCLFFASVYEKYSLCPLNAWLHISAASSRFLTYRKAIAESPRILYPSGPETSPEHLAQRLYWSLFRAESELVTELGVTPSGLHTTTGSGNPAFPIAPSSLNVSAVRAGSPDVEDLRREEEERTWLFYIAEISWRRAVNETLWSLYSSGEDSWLSGITSLVRGHEEGERQVADWYASLPPSLKIEAETPPSELSMYIHGRVQSWREMLLRPHLYYALHHHPSSPPSARIVAFAQSAVDACVLMVRILVTHQYRYDDTWLGIRRMWGASLLVLAAVFGGGCVVAPADWEETVEMGINGIRVWEEGREDVKKAREILEELYEQAKAVGGRR